MTHSGIDKWPDHGGGVQLVNIIGEAVGLWKSKGGNCNPVYDAKSKSLGEESRQRLTSCSYPPNMYMALARTQAEWPSLAPGTVPVTLGMNHLWVSVSRDNSALGAVVTDASSQTQWRENTVGHLNTVDVPCCTENQSCSFAVLMSPSHTHLPTSCMCTLLRCFPCVQNVNTRVQRSWESTRI